MIIICLCRHWENVVEQLFTHVGFFYVRGQVRLITPASIRLAVNSNYTSFFILKMRAVSRAFFPEYKELFFFLWVEKLTGDLWALISIWEVALGTTSLQLIGNVNREKSISISEWEPPAQSFLPSAGLSVVVMWRTVTWGLAQPLLNGTAGRKGALLLELQRGLNES